MALYLAPKIYKERIQRYLHQRYPSAALSLKGTSYREAKTLVLAVCADRTIVQPAVKLVCVHEALKVSAWLGIELHAHTDFVEMISADLMQSKFLFYDDGNNRAAEWTLLELYPSS